MLITSIKNQNGMSLVELMVAMVVGLLIVAAAGTSYIVSNRSSRDTINVTRLNMELRGAIGVMTDEIRRAGSTGAFNSAGVNNAFTNQTSGARTDLLVTASCTEFTYDADGDGTVDANEYIGFRVRNETIEMRTSGTTNNCTDNTNETWQPLTDDNTITIQQIGTTPYFRITFQCLNTANDVSQNVNCNNFDYTGIASGTTADLLETRTVELNFGGRLVSDAAMQMQLSQQVQVRNHRVIVGTTP